MNTKVLFAIFAIATFLPLSVLAQDANTTNVEGIEEYEISEDPGTLPDSPFYGLKIGWENIRKAFIFNEEKRVEFELKLTERRMAELERIENKTDMPEEVKEKLRIKIMERTDKLFEKIEERVTSLNQTRSERIEQIKLLLVQNRQKQLHVLERVSEHAPEEARERILANIEKHQEKYDERLEELKEKLKNNSTFKRDFEERINRLSERRIANGTARSLRNRTERLATRAELETYTLSQVNEHNTESDCWLILEDKVYDVTEYISAHPEDQVIIEGCGTDATTLLETLPVENETQDSLSERIRSVESFIGLLEE